ncbi:hypothetical protein AOLI_G00051580 [Acnodon oligacanthus]
MSRFLGGKWRLSPAGPVQPDRVTFSSAVACDDVTDSPDDSSTQVPPSAGCPGPGLQLQALPAQPRPPLADSSFSLYSAPPAVSPGDARLFSPPPWILQDADVSLPLLLHPFAASSALHTTDAGDVSLTLKSADPRMSKDRTAPEFTLTFSIYRDVICSAFLSRCQELNDYLSIILDLAVHFIWFLQLPSSVFSPLVYLSSAVEYFYILWLFGSRALLPHFRRLDCTLL